MQQEKLNKIIENHQHYLAKDCKGWKGMRADLCGANLSGTNLYGVNLSKADLRDAILNGANLCGANLSNADLSYTDLGNADLRGADLGNSDLHNADLSGATLSGAYLYGVNLSKADLRDAKLDWADLRSANLSNANLRYANMRDAHLGKTILDGVKYNECTSFFALVCPEEGDFIGWKKVDKVIIKLRIPSESKRSSATTRKCRCEYAEVLELQNLDGTPYKYDKVFNHNYVTTTYKIGEIVRADSWDENRWNECSNGIHFFITRDEAVRY